MARAPDDPDDRTDAISGDASTVDADYVRHPLLSDRAHREPAEAASLPWIAGGAQGGGPLPPAALAPATRPGGAIDGAILEAAAGPSTGRVTRPGEPAPSLLAALRGSDDDDLPAEHPGRYGYRGQLGEGGIGTVDRVFDRHLRREVALKSLKPARRGEPPPSEGRFLDEARVTGLLEHPGIIPVYELGRRVDGTAYYTMKQVRGRTLRDAFVNRSLPERLALLPRFIDVCQAMAYAHDQGVIHRDLKPDNVMLGDFGETWVLDWGLAKVRPRGEVAQRALTLDPDEVSQRIESLESGDESEGRTQLGQVLGTPRYMPPEQVLGQAADADARADVYALGAMLYELLTLETPFGSGSFTRLAQRILTAPLRSPAAAEPECPPELSAIAVRALARDPTARYPDAGAMADDLLAFQAGGWVRAHAYTVGERVQRLMRRHRGALVLCVAVLAVAVGAWVWRGQQEAAHLASVAEARRLAAVQRIDSLVAETRIERTTGWLGLYASRIAAVDRPVAEARMIALLDDPAPAMRQLAARTLGTMSSATAVEPLMARLVEGVEPEEAVLVEIIRALGIIGDPRAERAVFAVRKREGSASYLSHNTRLAYQMLPPEAPPGRTDANAWVDYGVALVEKGRNAEGIEAYDQAIALDPLLARAWNNRGLVRRRLRQYAAADADLSQALSLKPDFGPALINRALVRRYQHRYPEALVDIDRAVAAGGKLATIARRSRARTRLLTGDFAGARADLDLVLAERPDARQNVGTDAWYWLARGELARALQRLDYAIRLQPEFALSYYQRARVRVALGELRAAAADLEQALVLDPDPVSAQLVDARAELARVRSRQGDRAGALAALQPEIDAHPTRARPRLFRAIFGHLAFGDGAAALADLDAAVERAAPGESALFRLLRRIVRLRLGTPLDGEQRRAGDVPWHDALLAVAHGEREPGALIEQATDPDGRCLLVLAAEGWRSATGRAAEVPSLEGGQPLLLSAACALARPGGSGEDASPRTP